MHSALLTGSLSKWIAPFLLLAACAAAPDTAKTWVGKDVADVIAKWGNPIRTVSLADGNALYFFPRRQQLVDFAEPIPQIVNVDSRGILYLKNDPAYLLRGDELTMRCQSEVFVIGPDNKVVTWRGLMC
jgi:hypothetical protein